MAQAAKKSHVTLEEGADAPDFDLPADNGKNISLTGLKGKNIVFYFYPKDDTPGCTLEGKDFSNLMKDFENANTAVIGVSKDSVESHCKFRDKYGYSILLASDEDGKACEAYGVWVEKNMYGKKYMGIERTTFLINKEGKIAHIWRKVKVDGHAKEVLAEAKKLA